MNKYAFMGNKYACAVVGARGYSGLELSRLLLKHPAAELVACFATDAGFSLKDYLPEASAAGVATKAMSDVEAVAADVDTVFLATPAEASLELAPKLLAKGARVVDLSGAYRLKGKTHDETKNLYKTWYGMEHTAPALVAEADFGLVPFAGPLGKTKLVANPGCYATSVLMAVLPLIKSGLIASETLVIDAKSGTSGGGRKAAENLLFTEVEGECLPYKVGAHQHFPEICGYVEKLGGQAIDPMLTTSLVNFRRGIIAGLYARTQGGVTTEAIAKAYAAAFEGYPLAKVTALHAKNERAELSLKRVVGSARVHIGFRLAGDKLYVFSLIDNLLKGAASQAVENFNRLHDLNIETGLTQLEGLL